MTERDRELEFYKHQADATGARVLQLVEEVAAVRRETARVRTVARLLRDAYPLTGADVKRADIGRRFLEILTEALNADRAAVYCYVASEGRFEVRDAIGMPEGHSAGFSMAEAGGGAPESFGLQRSGKEPDEMGKVLRKALGVPYFLWAFDEAAGVGLLVGSEVEDARLHAPFESRDREIIRGALDVFVEISELARMREALRDSEENLRITLKSIGDAVISTDKDARVVGMNPVAEALTGWTAGDAAGKPLDEVLVIRNSQTGRPVESPVERVLREGKVVGLANHTILVSRDGKERQIADSGAPICNDAGQIVGVVLVFRDVTEEYTLQERLRQSQKLEAIGQLAGGIAHDFNNMLTSIIGFAELLQDSEVNADQASDLDTIIKSAQDAASLTDQLLTFARKGKYEERPVNIDSICEELVRLLGRTVDRRIAVGTELNVSGCVVLGDRAQIKNALLNLALNARDAMPEGGVLTIATRETILDEGFCGGKGFEINPGRFVEIAVIDTGIGMSPDVLDRMFEPFFTTKGPGMGTGMGLACVYGTAKSHRGCILVESKPGAGSAFRVYLPLMEEKARTAAVSLPAGRRVEKLRILVVDDEPSVLKMVSKLLGRSGHEVISADRGDRAIEIYEKSWPEIDVVVLDMIMPGMHGSEVFRKMREINPKARVLVCTGYSIDRDIQSALNSGAAGIVRKPFRPDQLLAMIGEACRDLA
jgi:PAS domain S-box-containing protein